MPRDSLDPYALKNPRPEGAEYPLTESAPSPFHAEPEQFLEANAHLDALQLAVALDLSELGLLDYFVVADKALDAVATLEGLGVLDPLHHDDPQELRAPGWGGDSAQR